MKRSREGEFDTTTMANWLMLLSRTGDEFHSAAEPGRVFECKTCNRQFPSFQALGGHRASHKRFRLMGGGFNHRAGGQTSSPPPPPKPKTHECSICGLEFAIGQALGGHMRRHRTAAPATATVTVANENQPPPELSLSPSQSQQAPVVKKSNRRKVLCLDLNLTPPGENGLDFQLEKVAPLLHCYL